MTDDNNQAQNEKLQKRLLIEQRVTNEGCSTGLTYIFWWFLGVFGAHRFYTGKKGSAIAMLIISLTFFGLAVTAIWWIVDAFLIPGMVREYNDNLRQKLNFELS